MSSLWLHHEPFYNFAEPLRIFPSSAPTMDNMSALEQALDILPIMVGLPTITKLTFLTVEVMPPSINGGPAFE